MATALPSHLTNFVGREDDIAALMDMIKQHRLVTLVGTGGMGKTRLALQVAIEVEVQFTGGVHILEFASLSDPAQVLPFVASSLGVREQAQQPLLQTLIEALQSKHILLIFDNCEHIIAATAALALSLLQRCPPLHLLATSREGLRLTGERPWRINSLSYPPFPPSLSLEDLMRYDAVQLFCARAVMAEPHFHITAQNIPAIARICHCLDGIPLALELAAASLPLLSVDQIADRLDERLQAFSDGDRTDAHHRTLQATFDWSYALLSTAEQKVLQRLSVFGNSWTLEAAEDICANELTSRYEILDILTELQNKSWIVVEEHKEGKVVRYRLLETIQKYAHQYLASENVQQLYVKHWEWYLDSVEEATHQLHGAEQAQWLHRVECEVDNLHLALERSLAAGHVEVTVRISAALGPFWVRRSRLSEGRSWYELLLARPDLAPSSRILLLQHIVEILRFQGEYIRIRSLLKERIALLRGLDAPIDLAEACCSLGWAAFYQGDCEEAITYCTEGLQLFRKAGNQPGIARCLSGLALVAMLQQEYSHAKTLLQEVVTIRRAAHDSAELAYALNAQARVALLQGEKALAHTACQESLQLVSALKQPFGTAYSFEAIAALAGACGCAAYAAQLFGAAHALRMKFGIPIPPALQAQHEYEVQPLRGQLGEQAFKEQWAHGQLFSLDEAYARALEVIEQVQAAASSNPMVGLSRREMDVFRLMKTGLTDAQVAEELVLSTRTVSTHLYSIYRKLGVTSRSAAIRFAVDHHLL